MKIYLIGFMGAGKSTIGRLLARRLGYDYLDTDELFAKENAGCTTADYIRQHGLEAFRPLERQTLCGVAARECNAVIATGAGISVYEDNLVVMMGSGWVVHLHTPLAAIEARMTAEELSRRPVWTEQSPSSLKACYDERLNRYNQAHCTVDGARAPEAIVSELVWRFQSKNVEERIQRLGILPVICPPNMESAVPLAAALCDGGLPAIEITLRAPWSLEAIRRIRNAFPEMLVGAGTVLAPAQVDKALETGAQFLVSPGLDAEVVALCRKCEAPIVPGCANASEMTQACRLGLSLLKFFPAQMLGGPPALRLYHGPFAECRFLPTGGIQPEHLQGYLELPYVAACGGSFCAKSSDILAGDWTKIVDCCRKCATIVATARATSDLPPMDVRKP